MTMQSIVCGSCKAAVPYGRLSCPSCGELLASVAGSRRPIAGAVTTKASAAKLGRAGSNGQAATSRTRAVPASASTAIPSVLSDPSEPAVTFDRAAPSESAVRSEPAVPASAATSATSAVPSSRLIPSVLADVPADGPTKAAAAPRISDPDDEPLSAAPASAYPDDQLLWAAPAGRQPLPANEADWDDEPIDGADVAPPSSSEPRSPSRPEPAVLMAVAPATAPSPAPATEPAPIASVAAGWPTSTTMSAAVVSSLPGAYVPPPPMPAIPSGPAAPARGWAGHADTATATGGATAEAADADDAPTRIAEFVRWLAVAGSALAAVGFLLPMASTVIGSTGIDFLDRWGLAGPFHFVVVLGLLGVLALALAVDRVPLWIRVGIPGVGLGALLIGLVWPYLLVSELRAGPGAVAILVGALLLGAAGVIALVDDRHGTGDRPV